MKKDKELHALVLLFLAMLVSVIFLAFKHEQQYDFFPFSDQLLTVQQYVWYFFEHFSFVLIGLAGVRIFVKYKFAPKVFLWLAVADTVDFCLTYSEPWFGKVVTFNALKLVTFGVAIAVDYHKHHVGFTKRN